MPYAQGILTFEEPHMNPMPQDFSPYAYLLLGLVLFLGVHSLRVLAHCNGCGLY